MSQDKRSQPGASAGQGQNIFSLYGYRPQFPANALVTDQPVQKEGTGGQPGGPGGNVYFSQLITEASHAGGQQRQSCVSASGMPQPQARPAPSPQQHHAAQVSASGLVAGQGQQQPVGQGFACGVGNLTSVFPVSTPNSASFHAAAAAHPASVSSVQASRGIIRQSAGLAANEWPAQHFSPYQSSGQVGMSASGSLLASSHIVVQPANALRHAPEMSLSAPLPSTASHSLIQQGLLANPLYSQGSVSSVGSVTAAHPHPLSQTAPTLLTSSVKMFPPAGQVTSSTSAQPSALGQGYGQGGKRKSSSPGSEGDLTPVMCDGKQLRTAGDGRTVWDIGRPGVSVALPMTSSAQLSAPHSNSSSSSNSGSGRGWSGGASAAANSSGFMDTFRSFVETSSSQGAYSQHKGNRNHQANAVVCGDPSSDVNRREEDLGKGNLSQHTVASSAGSQEGYRLGDRPAQPQPQSQSFVEKMHATIFSLSSEEVSTSSSAPAVGEGDDVQQSHSGINLASILRTVGNLDKLDASHPQNVSSSTTRSSECSSSFTSHTHPTLGQRTSSSMMMTPRMDGRKSSLSPPVLHSTQSDGHQRAVKSEEQGSASDAAADRSSASASPDGTASSDSEIESEPSSTNSKKRPKSSNTSTASKKVKTEKTEPVTQTPCVSGGVNKKRAKGTKNTTKVWAWDRPLVKVSVATLKRTGAPFLQNGPCSDLPTKVSKCSECRTAINQGNNDPPSIFCRFYAFRRLKYHTAKGSVMKAGFSELSDADPDHIEPWLPKYPMEDPQLDKDMAKFILSKVGDKFCELVQQEKEAKTLPGADVTVVWKRAVTGVREMCDVCETTIFNMHWVCSKCGYVVCLDCYKAKVRVNEGQSQQGEAYRKWQICTSSRYPHDASKLILTQIIPSDALWELGRMIHDIRRKWSIPTACPCGQGGPDPAISKSSAKKTLNGVGEDGKSKTAAEQPVKKEPAAEPQGGAGSQAPKGPPAVKKDGASGGVGGVKQQEGGGGGQKLGGCTSLRELLTKTAGKGRVGLEKKPKHTGGSSLSAIIQSVVEKSCRDMGDSPPHAFKFLHYIPRLGQWTRELPIVAHSLTETSVLYPDVPHSWLCDGRLLRLHEPHHRGNLQIFQEQWKRGQPVMVSCVHKLVKEEQWKPTSFSRQFGHKKNDLINCHSGDVITDHPMKDFWDGFESIENRLVDEEGQDLMLKLKDWPPGDDFAELLPSLFNDLMAALPLPEYTRRDGKLNLASRLPEFLVRPDLGPKMYNAFGSAKFPKEATTNLHLDISDAVNVLVYVGVPSDGPRGKKEHEESAVKAIDEAGCDSITKRRIREVHELPGALWQIYDAHDADKIRDFLNKVAKERGEEIEPNHDPIHDQSWYLDEELRDRLLKEYGVHGYTIVQCLGDSIFIPAGAPHQVRNLHSCIKVAEDFVSPEHLNHCFRLTQEFRQLSDTHSNHEDKLQVKNIIYHAVKDSIAVLREMDPDDEH